MPEQGLYKKLKIIEIRTETKDAKTFVLEPLEGWDPHYSEGQFLTLVFETRYGEKRRSYSISSSVSHNDPLAITVKKIDNGEFSRLLNYHAKEGDVLITTGIAGFFVLPPEEKNIGQYFFMAAGSGITPCFSIIKKLLLSKTNKEVVLIYSNKSESDTIFYNDLKKLQEKYSERLRVKFLFSDRVNIYESRLSHWLLPQFLNNYLKVPANNVMCYVCGPFDYMRMVEITLLSRFPKTNIIKENFNHWPRLIIPQPPDTDRHEVTIKINKQQFVLGVQYPENIHQAAKRKGINLPYSCEAGMCGSCAATCTSGKIWMAYNEVLTDNEVNNGRVLICQAYPVGGDAVVEFGE